MLVSGAEVDIRNITMKMADKVSRQVNFLVCNICRMIWTLTRHYNVLHVLTLFPTKQHQLHYWVNCVYIRQGWKENDHTDMWIYSERNRRKELSFVNWWDMNQSLWWIELNWARYGGISRAVSQSNNQSQEKLTWLKAKKLLHRVSKKTSHLWLAIILTYMVRLR